MNQRHTFKDWLLATRPWSLPASTMPALVAVSYVFATKYTGFNCLNFWLSIACVVGVAIFHLGGNLVSDYYDYKTGVDRKDNTGQRLLVDGVFEAKTILFYGLILLFVGSVLGLFIVWKSNINVLYVGLAGFLLTYFYSKLKYKALGDVTIFLIFGILIAMGVSFVLTNTLKINILLSSMPVGFLVVGILHSNNTRDAEFDARAKIRTFAMNIGLKASKIYYFALVSSAYIMVIVLILTGISSWLSLIVLFSLPIAIKNVQMMLSSQKNSDISGLDGATAKLVLVFSLLLIIANITTPFVV